MHPFIYPFKKNIRYSAGSVIRTLSYKDNSVIRTIFSCTRFGAKLKFFKKYHSFFINSCLVLFFLLYAMKYWGEMKIRVGGNCFFPRKLKKNRKILSIALEVAFILLLRWVLGFKDNSIIRTRTTCPYNRAGTVHHFIYTTYMDNRLSMESTTYLLYFKWFIWNRDYF